MALHIICVFTGLADAESLIALKDMVNKLGGESVCTEEVSILKEIFFHILKV